MMENSKKLSNSLKKFGNQTKRMLDHVCVHTFIPIFIDIFLRSSSSFLCPTIVNQIPSSIITKDSISCSVSDHCCISYRIMRYLLFLLILCKLYVIGRFRSQQCSSSLASSISDILRGAVAREWNMHSQRSKIQLLLTEFILSSTEIITIRLLELIQRRNLPYRHRLQKRNWVSELWFVFQLYSTVQCPLYLR